MMIPSISIIFYRIIDGETSISFSARLAGFGTGPDSCVFSVLDTVVSTEEHPIKTYGGDPFQALYLGMRTILNCVRRHFESLPDEMFGLPDEDLLAGEGHKGSEMLEWLPQAYGGWETRH